MDIGAWLRDLGLERYAPSFRDAEITPAVLSELAENDLKELGLPLGPRKLLLKAIASLSDGQTDAPAISPTRAPRDAERRQLTVMFCDLVGSTALSAKLDPEDMREVIRAYQNTVAGEIGRFEGHVAKFMGDGVLAYFGWPRAHEDEAERAVRTALVVANAVGKLATPAGEALSARVGIATGMVVVGDLVGEGAAQEEAVVGDTPNLAARLQGVATPGQVVIADATRRLVGGSFELQDLGERKLKGIGQPAQAFAVIGERLVESRFEAVSGPSIMPMVGRGQELALLLERWTQAKGGEGQGVLLVGEAGIGKSRIVRALLDTLAAEPHTRIRYQCSPYHRDSALWPVIQQLSRAAGFAADDTDDTRLDKLEALLARGDAGAQATPLIADLVGLDGAARYDALDLAPQAQRARTLDALVRQFLELAARQPLLMVLEDAHWIDPTTLELIEQSLDRIAAARVLILLTSRPDDQPGLAAHPHVTRLTLNRLGRAGVEAIVARLGGDRLPSETIDTIIARTDGVPLFVEELTKAVLEAGETTIPASLHDSLMARLDRLPEVKEIAQIAACVGREFDYPLLAAVLDQPDSNLQTALDKLAAAELIFRRGTPPHSRYTFKHALVQDAAYQSLLRSRRQQLHRDIVQALEARFAETAETEPELLAHHLTAAGEAERAVDYWSKAGRRAFGRSAYAEAIAHLSTGLELLKPLAVSAERHRRELELQNSRALALLATRGWAAPETGEAFARARQLCRELGNPSLTFPVLRGLHSFHWVRAEHGIARDIGHECLDLAELQDDSAAMILAHRLIGQALWMLGELTAGRDHLERAIALYDPKRHGASALVYGADSRVVALAHFSGLLWVVGYPEQACRAADQALSGAGRQEGKFGLVHAMYHGLFTRLLRRDHQAVLQGAEMVAALAREHGVGAIVLLAEVLGHWARLAMGKRGEDIDAFADSINAKRANGDEMITALHLGALAEALAVNGRVEEALTTIAEALEVTERTDERWSEAELHRLGGQILLMRDGLDTTGEAEARYRRSLNIACAQQAKSWELRTATSLARLWRDQGKSAEAHDLLAPIYGWFTEGFDTADLKEAKALLDELS